MPVAFPGLHLFQCRNLDRGGSGSERGLLVRFPAMPMRATTVRFADSLWTLVEQEAQREGVSAAHFIRDATIMRAAYAMGQRGDPDFEAALRSAHAAARGRSGARSERRRAPAGAARRGRRRPRPGAGGRAAGDRAARLGRRSRLRPPRAARRPGPQRAGRARLARRRRPPVLQELPRAPGAVGLAARDAAVALLLPARGGEPRAADRRRRARARRAARQPRHPRHGRRRLRRHPADRRRGQRARHPLRDRQPAAPLDQPSGRSCWPTSRPPW